MRVTRVLISNGADIDTRNNDGETPHDKAIQHGTLLNIIDDTSHDETSLLFNMLC